MVCNRQTWHEVTRCQGSGVAGCCWVSWLHSCCQEVSWDKAAPGQLGPLSAAAGAQTPSLAGDVALCPDPAETPSVHAAGYRDIGGQKAAESEAGE